MSKKSKRQSRKTSSQRANASRLESMASPTGIATDSNRASIIENSGKGKTIKPFEQEFNPDYSQTIKDLRRIGTLAGTFFLVLVVLSFFLR
jgi:hypothetical protein